MTDHPAKVVLSVMAEDAKRGPLARPLLIARMIAICAAVAGAVPTAITFYHSWVHGIPYSQVSHRLTQYDLWVKNFDCKIDYRALNTGVGTRVDAGACPKSGDIAIKIVTQAGKATYEWLAFDDLQKASATSALLNLLVAPAMAEEGAPLGQLGTLRFAQASGGAGHQVVCQAMPTKGQIVRVVQFEGKCFRETFSPFVGKVDKRESVPCNTTCPATHKG